MEQAAAHACSHGDLRMGACVSADAHRVGSDGVCIRIVVKGGCAALFERCCAHEHVPLCTGAHLVQLRRRSALEGLASILDS